MWRMCGEDVRVMKVRPSKQWAALMKRLEAAFEPGARPPVVPWPGWAVHCAAGADARLAD